MGFAQRTYDVSPHFLIGGNNENANLSMPDKCPSQWTVIRAIESLKHGSKTWVRSGSWIKRTWTMKPRKRDPILRTAVREMPSNLTAIKQLLKDDRFCFGAFIVARSLIIAWALSFVTPCSYTIAPFFSTIRLYTGGVLTMGTAMRARTLCQRWWQKRVTPDQHERADPGVTAILLNIDYYEEYNPDWTRRTITGLHSHGWYWSSWWQQTQILTTATAGSTQDHHLRDTIDY